MPRATTTLRRQKPGHLPSASMQVQALTAAVPLTKPGRPNSALAYTVLLLATAVVTRPALARPVEDPQLRSSTPAPLTQPATRLWFTITDENGVAVRGARVALTSGNKIVARCETDLSGRCLVARLVPGAYALRVEKVGFYRLTLPSVDPAAISALDITLTHEQEVRETVDVVESAPAIDPAQTARSEALTAREILNVPYPTSRDVRRALPLMPGVVADPGGAIHVAGSSARQTLETLDGFDITDPVGGFMNVRVNADSVRTISADSSRYSSEFGRGSSLLSTTTGMGDDRFRFAATNFLPSFTLKDGFSFNQWVPRATFSGPIKRGRIWFFEAPEAAYGLNIVNGLPHGRNTDTIWRTGNLLKLQMNVTPANILTGEFILDNYHEFHAGLSQFNPVETTTNVRNATYLGAIRDQHYFHSGALLELAFAATDFSGSSAPRGAAPFEITPEVTSGSFYVGSRGSARRYQGLANLYLPAWKWRGRHEFKLGLDSSAVSYFRTYNRRPIFIHREDGTLARRIEFPATARVEAANVQHGAYAQDRWSPNDRLLLEPGIRLDWDELLRRPVFAPRVAATYVLNRDASTKLSAGLGWSFGVTHLEPLSRPGIGDRRDFFYAADGATVIAPDGTPCASCFVLSRLVAEPRMLKAPRFFNVSFGVEHKLPAAVYVAVDFLSRREKNGFVYQNLAPAANPAASPESLGVFLLTNARQDHYDSVQFTVRHTFKSAYPLMVSYTRSSARTNTLQDFAIDNPALFIQQRGRLLWDTPNRVVGWGWFPFIKKIDIGYAVEARDGFPFNLLDQEQRLVAASARRLPPWITLSVAAERRFHIFGMFLALRGTMENATGRHNATSVNNNIDSPQFLTLGSASHRVFTGRIRFLGRSRRKTDANNPPPPALPPKTKP